MDHVTRGPVTAEPPTGLSAPAVAPTSGRSDSGPLGFLSHTASSLRHRDYRYLWMGTLFMSAGQWVQQVTMGWLLYDLTGSAVLLGAMNGLRALPFLIAGPIAGVAADRLDRRKMLIGLQPIVIVGSVAMGLLVSSGLLEVWHLFVFALFMAMIWSINNPVRQALVPSLVPKQDLMNAIALNSVGFNSNKVIGPAIGGALIVWFGAGGNFFVQAAAFAAVMVMIFRMRVPQTPEHARRTSVMSNLREGLAYVWHSPVVMGLMITALVPQIFAMPVTQALLPVYQKDVLGVGPEGLGLLMGGPGLGAVIATLLLASMGHRFRRKGLIMLGGLMLLGLSLVLFSQMPSLPLAVLSLVSVGAFQQLYMTTSQTLLQVIVPDELRGRVMSIYMADHGLGPAGALLAGISTQILGAPTTTAIFGTIVFALALVVAWRVPRLREVVA